MLARPPQKAAATSDDNRARRRPLISMVVALRMVPQSVGMILPFSQQQLFVLNQLGSGPQVPLRLRPDLEIHHQSQRNAGVILAVAEEAGVDPIELPARSDRTEDFQVRAPAHSVGKGSV